MTEEILPTPLDWNIHTEDCGRMPPSNLHLAQEREDTFVVKQEPEEILPSLTGETECSEDCCGISTSRTPHLEGKTHNTIAVKEELDDVSAVSSYEGFYHEDAPCVFSSHNHLVQDEMRPVGVKEESEEILPNPTGGSVHSEDSGGISPFSPHLEGKVHHTFAVKKDSAETDLGDEEECFDSDDGGNDLPPRKGGSHAWQVRTDQRQDKHQCRFCTYTSYRAANVTIHERTHTGEKPFGCSACHKVFRSKFNLLRHERVHTGEKPFTCDFCHKAFTQKPVLLHHERVHTGERPFECRTCGSAFKRQSVLIHHERIHTGEKPFRCQTCQKAFTQKCALVHHERGHTGDRPFKCETCGKAFVSRRNLSRHSKSSHM